MFDLKGVGLDISDSSLEVLELKKFIGPLKVASYNRRMLESGIVEDGKIFQLDKLVTQIKELFNTATPHPIKTHALTLSLPESQVFIHTFNFPLDLNAGKIDEAIQYQLPETIPFALADVYYDWRVLTTGATHQEVLLAAAPREIVAQYIKLAEQLQVQITALTLESLSTAQALAPEQNNQQVFCLLDCGARTTLISIFDAAGLRLSHNHPQAGQYLTDLLAEKLKVSNIEAEKLKYRYGLDPQSRPAEVAEILAQGLKPIMQELKKSIDYYESQAPQKVSKIILSGGGANLKHWPEYLTGILELPTHIGAPLAQLGNSDIIKVKAEEILMANVIGLAQWSLNKKFRARSLNLLST